MKSWNRKPNQNISQQIQLKKNNNNKGNQTQYTNRI